MSARRPSPAPRLARPRAMLPSVKSALQFLDATYPAFEWHTPKMFKMPE